MRKRIITAGLWTGIFLASAIMTYAVTTLFFSESQTSDFSKKQIFQFDFDTGLSNAEIGPGDSFAVNPVIYNDATEEMYEFIQIDMPSTEKGLLYSFEADSEWCIVSEDDESVVYAYGGDEMYMLHPGETTTILTEQMTMREISNAEYAVIDDINFTITGYAIGTEDISLIPEEAWEQCKIIEENQY